MFFVAMVFQAPKVQTYALFTSRSYWDMLIGQEHAPAYVMNLIVIFSSPSTFFFKSMTVALHYDFTNKGLKKSQKPINRAFLLVERHNNLLPTSGTGTDV